MHNEQALKTNCALHQTDQEVSLRIVQQNFLFTICPVLASEVFLVSVVPVPCLEECFCHYSVNNDGNTMDCSHNNMTQLPDQVLPRSEHFIMTGNNLENLICPKRCALLGLTKLSLENNSVRTIDETFLKVLLVNGVSVNLSGNKINQVPLVLASTQLNGSIWLGHNPYECHCDMMWMQDWLLNATNVMDKALIKCGAGNYEGGQTASLCFY